MTGRGRNGGVYTEERGRGPLLVCIHGLGGGGYFFAGLLHALADRHRVVALDLPGHGYTPRGDEPFSFSRAAEAVVEVVRRTGDGPAVVLGHSMGVILALQAYALEPALVRGLVFVGGLPEPPPDARQRFLDRARLVRENGMQGIGETVANIVFATRSRSTVADKIAMFRRLLEASDPLAYAEANEALAAASARDVVPRVGVRSLCLTGVEDSYATPAAAKAFAAELPPGTRFATLEGCGHMPFFEAPQILTETVGTFLEGLP